MCADSWPGLIMECARAMSAMRPNNKIITLQKVGCTEVMSRSRHWPCLFPQHGPGRKHTWKIELEQWQVVIVREYPGEFARGLFHSDGWQGVNRVRRRLPSGDRWYEYPRYLFSNESRDILRLCGETLGTGSGWPGGFPAGTPYPWRGGRRWSGWMSSWGPNTEAVRAPRMRDRGSGPQ